YYFPAFGAPSYNALSINVSNPSLGPAAVAVRKRMRAASQDSKVGYIVFGAVILYFGSVLLWRVMGTLLSENSYMDVACGMSSALGLVKAGKRQIDFFDSQVKNLFSHVKISYEFSGYN
ncbi:uncharacterized protein LOC126263513, partial [Schistocerca nitens]|uniref:uncharacterized protein LOC126263513 n=1 Tax=Schistocerca nitens TaxID=7011 RepID=UPI002118FD05